MALPQYFLTDIKIIIWEAFLRYWDKVYCYFLHANCHNPRKFQDPHKWPCSTLELIEFLASVTLTLLYLPDAGPHSGQFCITPEVINSSASLPDYHLCSGSFTELFPLHCPVPLEMSMPPKFMKSRIVPAPLHYVDLN